MAVNFQFSTNVALAYNVTIIAAVADLKAQMFNLKNKVYEYHRRSNKHFTRHCRQ
jgi:hypothetical protein